MRIQRRGTIWAGSSSDIFKLRAERVAFVKGDDTVAFADVARAIDVMRSSSIEKVGLITAKLEVGQ